MTTATIRLPVRSALIQAPPYPAHGVEVLASIRLDTLADALRSMEHDDLDPGERPMSADQCRDALLRELLGGWSPSELVEARIPGVLQMADEIATLRRERDEARRSLSCILEDIEDDDNGDGMMDFEYRTQAHEMWLEGTSDDEPDLSAIHEHAKCRGFALADLQVWKDSMQGFWRFGADLRALAAGGEG